MFHFVETIVLKATLEPLGNPGEDDEENGEPPRRKSRLGSKSPGRTPKSSIHRTLAKVGLLDSPGDGRQTLLEEFFDRFAEARPLGVGEDEIRAQLAVKYDMTTEAVARRLVELGNFEQCKGQRGLSKFLSKWKEVAEGSPESEGQTSSWSVIPEGPVRDLTSAKESPAKSTPTPPPGIPGSWEQRTVGLVRPPSTYGDRKAGAGPGETGGTQSMAKIAEAIQHQTAELANLVRSQVDVNSHPAGTLKGLAKLSEELVFLMRACGQYDVKLCPNEYGQSLAQGLLSAQHGAATRLRNLGCRQKMTPRLAIGLAGPYWGTQEKYAVSVADFVAYTDAELDTYAWEAGKAKPQSESRPAAPTRLEEWESRVRRQIDIWCLTYGEEWREVKTKAAKLLATWHTSAPHQWPLTVLMDCWEELHWRFTEELKEILRSLKREAGRETMTLNEVKFHALMPDSSGYAWLQLPNTFDLEDPNSWFATEVKPRIDRKQDRALWRLTWEGPGKRDRGAPAGAREEEPQKSEKPTLKTLWGPKLTPEEVTRARERAPTDREGKLLCWGFLTHMGCNMQGCQRSHEQLRGAFEALDPAVQMQLLRRGGLKRMKMDSKEKVAEKIKAIRAQTRLQRLKME